MADSNRKGAFLLSDVRQRSLDGYWENASTNAQYSWQGAGSVPAASSTVDRVDLSNDTAIGIARGNLTVARYELAAVGNANYGWWSGGYSPSPLGYSSVVDRITYASDSSTASARGNLSIGKYKHTTSGNSNYGWHVAGDLAGITTSVDRITYASDTATATARGPLSVGRATGAGGGNDYYGWHGGGQSPGPILTSIERIDYSNDLAATSIRGPYNFARYYHKVVGNANYGWQVSGYTAPASLTTVERIDYSNDTAIAVYKGPISTARRVAGASSNSNYGWIHGGFSTVILSSSDRIDFSNDLVIASPRGILSATRYSHAATAGIANYPQYPGNLTAINATINGFGWLSGSGGIAPQLSSIFRIDFSNDSLLASSRSPLSSGKYAIGGSNNSNYGWFVGGRQFPGSTISTTDRVNYSNDLLVSLVRGSNSTPIQDTGATGNANFGWFADGVDNTATPVPNGTTYLSRITYSNDSSSLLVRTGLPTVRYQLSASANASYGWFVAGYNNSGGINYSLVERLDFSTELTATPARGVISLARNKLAGVGNANFGWHIGGQVFPAPNAHSIVDRIDYSNDTSGASVRGVLATARLGLSVSGNANYAWASNGYTAAAASLSTVERIDYSNDSVTAVARGATPVVLTSNAATSNYVKEVQQPFIGGNTDGSFGWVMVGSAGGVGASNIERLDFANDLATANIRSNISQTRRFAAAGISNNAFGWLAGGFDPATSTLSSIVRLTFSNDTAGVAARGTLSSVRLAFSGASTDAAGWYTGGQAPQPTPISNIDRLEFANDTAITKPRSNTSIAKGELGAAGNSVYAWIVGGSSAPNIVLSTVDRITYANDAIAVSARGLLTVARSRVGATSTQNYGWVAGGVATPGTVSTIDRIDFANDSITALSRGPLNAAKYGVNSISSSVYGWFTNGYSILPLTGSSTTVDRVDYSNDSVTATARGFMVAARYQGAGVSNYVKVQPQPSVAQYNIGSAIVGTNGSGLFGYWAGGGPSANVMTTVDRLAFSNDTSAVVIRGGMVTGRWLAAGVNNSNYGWLADGFSTPAGFMTSVERIDYSNDGTAAIQRGAMAAGRYYGSGASNSNFGWIGGGGNPGQITQVDRIAFSNDSATAIVRGPLSIARSYNSSAGNANYGWWVGGQPSPAFSTVDRLDFSNDSATARVRGPLAAGRYGISGVSNSNYGWFGGGYVVGQVSTVSRVDFANDTVQPLARGVLSLQRQRMGASGNTNYGWFGGGANGAAVVNIDRVDYANDSVTAAARSSLSPGSGVPGRVGVTSVSNYTK